MNVIFGAFLAVIGGAVNGMFALPMKLAKKWSWENVWLPFSALALVIFPYLVAVMGAPRLAAAYANAEPSSVLTAVIMGICAYAGSLLFGISLGLIGNSLAFSLLVGSMSAVGVLGPMLLFHPEKLVTPGGRWIDLGILLMFAALVVCARAGSLMGKAKAVDSPQTNRGSVVVKGMLLAIAGGVLSGFLPMGLSMAWAHDIASSAIRFGGAGQTTAQNVVLLPVLIGGALPNCLYAAWLLFKNKTHQAYRESAEYWLIILLMGVLYTGSTVMWGMSSSPAMLGTLGPSVGWALFIGGLVVSSNIGGFATGEWKGAGTKALRLMVCGVLIMVVAATCIGYGNYRLN
jgi:L-rhamnose-H+ transport protein